MNIKTLIISVICTVIAYGAWIALTDYEQVLQATRAVGWQGIGIALSLSMVNYLLRYYRWQAMIIRVSKRHVPALRHLLYYFAGFALTTTPGKAGEAIRSVYLKRHNVDYSQSIAALFAERLFDMLAVLLIAIAALYHFSDYRVPAIFLGIATLGVVVIVQSAYCRDAMRRIANRFAPEKMAKWINHGISVFDQSSQLLGPRFFFFSLLLGIIAWGAEAVAFAIILDFMGLDISALVASGVYALGMLAGALSLMPGGLGGAEIAMIGALKLMSASVEQATSATLICRVTTLWFAVFLGAIAMIILELIGVHTPKNAVLPESPDSGHQP